MRILLKDGQRVRVKATGYVGKVQCDYEDLIYLYGVTEPFTLDQIEVL